MSPWICLKRFACHRLHQSGPPSLGGGYWDKSADSLERWPSTKKTSIVCVAAGVETWWGSNAPCPRSRTTSRAIR